MAETEPTDKAQDPIAAQDAVHPPKDVLRDNAPRIVGALKFIPDICLFISGLKDTGNSYFRSAAALGFMASRSILLIHGTKDKKSGAANANNDEPDKKDKSLLGTLKYNFYKVTHPEKYPVESGAGVATLAGIAVALSGASLMRNKKTFVEGATELGIGLFTSLAEGNVLFSAEKPKEETTKDSAKKKPSGILQTLKDQPVLLSGITQAVVSGSQIGLGLMTWKRQKNWFYLAAGSIYTAADLIYAFFVRKNEFHADQKPPAQTTTEATPSPSDSAPVPTNDKPLSTIQQPQQLGNQSSFVASPALSVS